MRDIASLALTAAAVLFVIVAVMLNSAALFYMCTAIIATIGASRLQSWLAVRALRFERSAPGLAQVGEWVSIEITVWSERRIRRPLITIQDNLPARMLAEDVTPSLPIAPAFDQPIRTVYRFRPMKRGRFRWKGLTVIGADALGLILSKRHYSTDQVELTIMPEIIPVQVSLLVAAGWGVSESESGRARGPGIEPYGIREYTSGDSLRHVHWRSSARSQKLLVKEFEAGSHASVAFVIQLEVGSDLGEGRRSTLDWICGHVAYLSQGLLRQGITVEFPEHETNARNSPDRMREILMILAEVEADHRESVAQVLRTLRGSIRTGTIVFVPMSLADEDLPGVASSMKGSGIQIVPMIYDADQLAGESKNKRPSASSDAYVGMLRSAGIDYIRMPIEEIRA